ncbi:MAG: HU family DNA-binding protein [Planctomycetes bacterium]|nr:HU family DNA-binding protein [Planctomycetota bacterium]
MDRPGPDTITKRDLVQRIAEQTGQTKVLVRDILQKFLDEVSGELIAGNRLEFRKFGVFEVRQRPGRVAQNPKTLQKVIVPAKRVVKFKVSNVLKKRVEGGEIAPSGLESPNPPSTPNQTPDLGSGSSDRF